MKPVRKLLLWIVGVFAVGVGFVSRDVVLNRYMTLVFELRRNIFRGRGMRVGENVTFYSGIVINSPGNISIGDDSCLGDYCHIWGGGGVEIGRDVLVAAHCAITSETHAIGSGLFRKTHSKSRVKIGDNVWIGLGVVVLPGVTIGNNCVIGAGAVVSKNVADNTVVAGVPAKMIRSLY